MAPDGDERDELRPQDPRQRERDELEPEDPRQPERDEPRPQDPVQRERELEEVRRSFTAVGRRLGTLGQRQRFATVLPVANRPAAPDDAADGTGADDANGTGADDAADGTGPGADANGTGADADTDTDTDTDTGEAGRAPALPVAALQLPTVEPQLRRRPRWLVAVLALGLIFTVGLLLGRTLDRSRPVASRATPAPSTIIKTIPRTATPPSCLAAVRQADRSIDYLVRKIRDQRLRDTLESFTKESRACQRAGTTVTSNE